MDALDFAQVVQDVQVVKVFVKAVVRDVPAAKDVAQVVVPDVQDALQTAMVNKGNGWLSGRVW